MNKIIQTLKRPIFYVSLKAKVRILAVLICLFSLMKIFAALAPPLVLLQIFRGTGANLFSEFWECFARYAYELQNTFKLGKSEILLILIFILFINISYSISSIFIIMIKSWARKCLLYSIGIETFFILFFKIFRTGFAFNLGELGFVVIYGAIIYFFNRKQVVQLFTNHETG